MRLLLQLLQLLLPLLLLLLLPLRLPAQQCLRRHCCAGIAVQANAWTALPAQQCLHRHCCADIAVQALQCSHFGPLVCPHPGPGVALAVLSRDARGTLAGRACAGVPVQACLCRRACAGVPVQAFLAGIPAQECVQAFVHGNVCRHSCTTTTTTTTACQSLSRRKVPETQGTLEIDTNSRATHFVKASVCPGLRG